MTPQWQSPAVDAMYHRSAQNELPNLDPWTRQHSRVGSICPSESPLSGVRGWENPDLLMPSQACEMCHRKKTQCNTEGSSPICVQCMRRNTDCVFPAQHEQRYGNIQCYSRYAFLIVTNMVIVVMSM